MVCFETEIPRTKFTAEWLHDGITSGSNLSFKKCWDPAQVMGVAIGWGKHEVWSVTLQNAVSGRSSLFYASEK